MLTVVVVIGLTGLGWTRTITAGTICQSRYTHQAIQPWLRDWWQCQHQTPCARDEALDRRNAAVQVIQCLCQNIPSDRSDIEKMYRDEVITYQASRAAPHESIQAPVSADLACQLRPIYRL